MKYIVGVLSPAIARRASVCVSICTEKYIQVMATESGISMRSSHTISIFKLNIK